MAAAAPSAPAASGAQPDAGTMLKFCTLESRVDIGFWSELAARKLDRYKLSDAPVPIRATFAASRYAEVASRLELDAGSFDQPEEDEQEQQQDAAAAAADPATHPSAAQPRRHATRGTLLLATSPDAWRALDRRSLLTSAAQELWRDVLTGKTERDPSRLCPLLLAAHGDLKRHAFDYHFCFPALRPPAGKAFTLVPGTSARGVDEALGGGGAAGAVLCACDEWRRRQGVGTPAPFWLVRLSVAGEDAETSASCHPLSAWAELRQEQGQVLVAMADPCHLPLVPGWPLRNLLMMASARWAGGGEDLRLRVLCVRDGSSTGRASAADGRSFVVDVCVPPLLQPLPPDASAAASADNETSLTPPTPEALGWEPDATGRPLPRHVDLSSHLSPLSLAEQAVALNLRLMRWRASPALDLAALAQCRCLLLGAGTLGCALARTLLAWGVRRITLVDDGRVSYSNPVRQSLYEHADCLDGGKPKAQAAADALVRVFPGVEARGVALCIPMPGHGEGETIEADALRLDTLVEEHDAVFLLTDTRESRWLPTLLAAARRKVAVTAALGFDGYLVMRHGVADEEEEEEAEGGGGGKEEGEKEEEQEQQKDEQQRQEQQRRRRRVGCYFCQDVVAPSDSTRARALDQQCTVARPGLAPIAGALSAELLAALLQHPLGVDAPAAGDEEGEGEEDATAAPPALGPVPHMIRGQLSGFSQVCMSGRAFPQCTACGPAVVRAWRERGAGLVREAADDPSALERLTGLGELREEAERRLGGLVLSEEEEDGGGKGGADDDEDDDWVDL